MTILFGIAAAIIGGLFWADRRRYYRHTYGSVLVSNDQDIGGGDVDAPTSRERLPAGRLSGRQQRRLSGRQPRVV